MVSTLTTLTLALVLIVVVALVLYLLLIIRALRGANENLTQLAGGLNQIVQDTGPLPQKMETINGALGQLLEGLLAANEHLAAVARLLRR